MTVRFFITAAGSRSLAGSVIPYFFYDLRGEKLDMIRAEMKIRREELSKSVSGGDGVEE